MQFATLIAAAGRGDLLKRSLDSIAQCELPDGYLGTYVCENGEKTGLEDVVRGASPEIRPVYLHSSEKSKSLALNYSLGALPSKETFVFFSDDDVRLSTNCLIEYANAAKEHPTRCFFGGPTGVDYADSPPPEWLIPFLPKSAVGMDQGDKQIQLEKAILLGFNWMAQAKEILDLGGFDGRYGPGSPTKSVGQESQMQKRLMRAGRRAIYLPKAKVWHWVPSDRINPKWALKRAFRTGISYGQLGRTQRQDEVFGIPRRQARKGYEAFKKYFKGCFHLDPQMRFTARFRLAKVLGFVKGYLTSE